METSIRVCVTQIYMVLESFLAEKWRILVAYWFKKGIDFNLARLGLKKIGHGKSAYIEI